MTVAVSDLMFSPLVPWWWLAALAGIAAPLFAFALLRRARGVGWRALMLAALILTLANPALVEEQREPQRDVALLVVDESQSQDVGARAARRDAALAALRERIARLPDLDLRVVRAGRPSLPATGRTGDADSRGGTLLFEAMQRALSDVPRGRIAGAILLTDGQVHDVPAATAGPGFDAPLHVLLTGERHEADRRLTVSQAPTYGIVGNALEMTVTVEDQGPDVAPPGSPVRLTLRRDGRPDKRVMVSTGREETIRFSLDHAGPTIIEVEVEPGRRELTLLNNRAVVVVNGVRDRLRVLLVSGEPHPGERVWRNLLKSDPAVDLVHFTILRPPEKQDATPIRELSLISFPMRELFEVKIEDFDLVLFDRYRRRGVIPQLYLENIARYVERGGAFLEAVGPDFADPRTTLYRTPLGAILPAAPTGEVYKQGFRPQVTDIGKRHPVTAQLGAADQPWGRWFRQVDADPNRGTALMTGVGDRPLLVLDRVGQGRVAQVLSDHIWLWARGFEGGGPQAELLRRLAHWLMKEPDLEEDALRATVEGDRLTVERRSLDPEVPPVTVTAPSGAEQPVELAPAGGGRFTGSATVTEQGLYRVRDDRREILAAAGTPNPVEFDDLRTTEERLTPPATASGGAMMWLAERDSPALRRPRAGQAMHGRDWIGLRANRDYIVTGVRELSLLPPVAVLALVLGALLLAWRWEAR